jgi:Fe/S biogenesis protein NfuA
VQDTPPNQPLLTITPAAAGKIAAAARSAGNPGACLRVAIAGRSGGRFRYDLSLVDPMSPPPGDLAIASGDTTVFVDPASADDLRGARVDLDASTFGGAVVIHNPNEGWSDPLAIRVQQVLDTVINPGIASHGGYIDLLDVRDQTAYIQMGGGCQGCGLADVTLKQGVEVAIRGAVPEIVAIVDTTDHASGTNPYYQPSKK